MSITTPPVSRPLGALNLRREPGALSLRDELPALPAASRPPTGIRRLVFLLVLAIAGFWGGLGTWAALAPIASAVVASGKVRVEGDLPVVQHLEGGLLREMKVEEGARVAAGQVLAVLDETVPAAQDGILRNQLVHALAQEERLAAEFRGAARLAPSEELAALVAATPSFAGVLASQRELFETDREMWRGQAEILKTRIGNLEEQLAGLAARRGAVSEQLALVRDGLDGLDTLYDKGLVTKARFLQQRDAEVSLMGDLDIIDSQAQSLHQQVSENRERILQLRRDRLQQISQQREAIKAQIFDIRQRITANEDVRERLRIRAPATGRVLGLRFTAPGEVIREGEEIMKIVPEGASYLVEGQVRPQDVDQVAEGARARVRLTAYNFRTTPAVPGEVVYVSADSLTDQTTGQPFFRVRIRLDAAGLAALPGVEMQPGMPAQLMIATGEQTMVDYLFGPILSNLNTALRESD